MAAVDPLLLASMPSSSSLHQSTDELSFDNYCIVCDRLIVPPKEVLAETKTDVKPKKKACGSVRVSGVV